MNVWTDHGTKILGFLVALIGAMGDVQQLFVAFDPNPKHVAAYSLIAALGGAIIKRGFTNTAQSPLTPMDKEKGVIDWHLLCVITAFLLVLSACAMLNEWKDIPLDAKVGAAKETVATIERSAATAVQSGTLSADTGRAIYDSAQGTVKYLDAAHAAIVAGNASESQAAYQLANSMLQALQAYVNSHRPKGAP